MGKIKILVIFTNTTGGVGFYRSYQPHDMLSKMYPDDFEVSVMTKPNFNDVHMFDKFDIVHFHKGVYFKDKPNQQTFTNLLKYLKENGIVVVMDIDDYWRLPTFHPQAQINIINKRNTDNVNTEEEIKKNMALADYVTTTTPIFANEIKPFNNNVIVFPNSINPDDDKFKIIREPSKKLRIGFIMGSTHEKDVSTMENFVSKLPIDILNKIEIVLCGFDLRGKIKYIDASGSEHIREASPKESVWYRYEKMLTNNYKIVSNEYYEYLMRFIPDGVYDNIRNECYKRCWTKDMDHYYQHYKEVDVLFAPLDENDFNKMKSELKPIECCFSHTAFVGSNFGPYTIGLRNLFKKGGDIDSEGNAILIDNRRAHKEWAKVVEKLVNHPEYVKILQDNLYRDFHEKYDLRNVTKKRAEFYKEITRKNK